MARFAAGARQGDDGALKQALGEMMTRTCSSLERISGFGRKFLTHSLLLGCVGLSFNAHARDHGMIPVCEPPGSTVERPAAESPLRHAIEASPERLDDGWSVSTLRAQGINPEPISEMLRAVDAGAYTKIDAILIARKGKLALEAYFNGFDRETRHDIQSVSKSFTSALAGIAIDRGLIADVNQPLSLFFPDYWPKVQNRLAKKGITLAHLLTMTSGLNAVPVRVHAMMRSSDWYRFALNLELIRKPGRQFAYSSPAAVLVGGVVARAAGEPLPAFARKHLFAPLGITDYCLSLTPGGQLATHSGIFMRPRDMLKFGQLYLDRGLWQGRRIISARWVAASTMKQVETARPDSSRSEPSRAGYGYFWWTRRALSGNGESLDLYLASGNGGQKIFVFPRLGMVVVFTGSHYGERIGHQQVWTILDRFILPAVLH